MMSNAHITMAYDMNVTYTSGFRFNMSQDVVSKFSQSLIPARLCVWIFLVVVTPVMMTIYTDILLSKFREILPYEELYYIETARYLITT